jgi:dimethylargininase
VQTAGRKTHLAFGSVVFGHNLEHSKHSGARVVYLKKDMLTAITRAVSPSIGRCELKHMERRLIDFDKAAQQHRDYERALADLGAQVISLPAENDLPDAVFVEDPAIVLDEVALITRMGAESRRGEGRTLAEALARFRPVHHMIEPGTVEGGDVLRIGHNLFVGESARTDAGGINALRREVSPFGYNVTVVKVHGCLHLKSAVSYLGNNTLLAHRPWIDMSELHYYRVLDVPPEEPWAANTLTVGDTVLVPAAFPATAAMLRNEGYRVRTLDISELMKAEAALTCSSLIFEA